jgi:hypothetical protein
MMEFLTKLMVDETKVEKNDGLTNLLPNLRPLNQRRCLPGKKKVDVFCED